MTTSTPQDREQLRRSILRWLDEANLGPWGMAATWLEQRARNEGLRGIAAGDLAAELLYLEDKGMLQRTHKTISPELTHWRITAAGRDELAMMS